MRVRESVIALALALPLSACTGSQQTNAFAPESSSASAAESLPARWWQWAESGGAKSPIADPTGRNCGINQPDDVWFLAGTFGGSARRNCRVPEDRPMYFPILNQICGVPPEHQPDRALEGCSFEADEMNAILDGQALVIEQATSEGSFTFTAEPDSVLGFPEGETEAVAWGHWVGPLTIPSGIHTLRFHARTGTFELSVTYDLTVG